MNNGYDYLINLALEQKDYKWVQELVKLKEEEKLESKTIKQEFSLPTAIALEDIISPYAVLEPQGLRNINADSNYDMMYKDIVFVGNTPRNEVFAKEKQSVPYYVFIGDELVFVRGYLIGFREGFDTSSDEIEKYFEEEESKDVKNNNKQWWQFWKGGTL